MKRLLPLALLTACFAAHAAAFENPRQAPGYMQSSWSTVHGDSSNSDHVPLAMTSNVRQRWHVLKGAGIWTLPVVAVDGTVYVATGEGPGHSHLHAISPEGEILWQSAPQQSLADLDSLAVFSAPVLDADGDIYIGDGNQFWAFHPDGKVKWVMDLPGLGIQGGFVTGMFVDDYVGGVSIDGKVMLLHRSSGELAMPVLDLPGADGPLGPPIPDPLWKNLVDPAIRDQVWEILRGHRYEIVNTPAVHPRTGRIYVIGAGADESEGHFYGIDVVDDRLKLAFVTKVPAGSGTSPGISPGGERLYAMAKGHLFAIDAESGEELWSKDVNGQDASPSVGPDDTVYILGGQRLVAVQGASGEIKWGRDYNDFVAQQLPELWTRFGLLEQGEPVGFIDSVASVTPDLMWTTVLGGYSMNLFGRKFTHAAKTWLIAIKPQDGSLIASYPLPDTSEGGITIGPMGELYLDMLAAIASTSHYAGYQWILPSEVQMPEPVGGLVAFEQADLKQHCLAGVNWAQRLLRSEGGDTVEAGLATERAAGQLTISSHCVSSLEPGSDAFDHAAEQLTKLAGQLSACGGEDCKPGRLAAELTPIINLLR
jgi:outer membrane protein assembly factor BamB